MTTVFILLTTPEQGSNDRDILWRNSGLNIGSWKSVPWSSFRWYILILATLITVFTASKLYLRWKNARQEALKLGALEVRLAIRTATFGLLVVLMIGLDVFGTIGSLSLYHDLIMACCACLNYQLLDYLFVLNPLYSWEHHSLDFRKSAGR